jgi:hypothetical protein
MLFFTRSDRNNLRANRLRSSGLCRLAQASRTNLGTPAQSDSDGLKIDGSIAVVIRIEIHVSI